MTAGLPAFPAVGRGVRTFYVGCYTAGTGGQGRGIEVVRHDPVSGAWTAGDSGGGVDVSGVAPVSGDPAAPSYPAWHPTELRIRQHRCAPDRAGRLGFGPRHVALLPGDLVAVAGELTGEIAVMTLHRDDGGLTLRGRTAGTATTRFTQPSGIAATADGRFVWMTIRGTDTIAAFELRRGAYDATPGLVLVDEAPCGGVNLRDITLVDETILCGEPGQRDDHGADDRARNGFPVAEREQPDNPEPDPSAGRAGQPGGSEHPGGADMTDGDNRSYRIVHLQIQRTPIKTGRAPMRTYDPAPLVPVTSIRVDSRGVHGVTSNGEVILDVHHQDHPDTRDAKGRAGILFIGTGDYAALRERYGEHVTDGIAGETILLEAPDGLAGGELPATAVVSTAHGPVELRGIRVAAPCVEFSRFCLGRAPSPVVDDTLTATLADLDGGSRGYRAIADGPGTISVGDIVTL